MNADCRACISAHTRANKPQTIQSQGSIDYVLKLRHALDDAGFGKVGITVEAEPWDPLVRSALTNATFKGAIAAGSAHYPCNQTVNSAATIQVGRSHTLPRRGGR